MCFSFHEIGVTALFRRNIGTCLPPHLFPFGRKKKFGITILSNFHLWSHERRCALARPGDACNEDRTTWPDPAATGRSRVSPCYFLILDSKFRIPVSRFPI